MNEAKVKEILSSLGVKFDRVSQQGNEITVEYGNYYYERNDFLQAERKIWDLIKMPAKAENIKIRECAWMTR
jgi:hypothetical protein